MKIQLPTFIGLLAAALIAIPVAAQETNSKHKQSDTHEFAIFSDRFSLELPEGYCLPTGIEAVVVRQYDEGDSQNITPVNIHRCGTFGSDYILIKSARTMPALPLQRSEYLDLLEVEMERVELLEKGAEIGQRDLENALNDQVDVVESEIEIAGRDEVCVYIEGRVAVADQQGKVRSMLVGSCCSLVGQRALVAHSYAFEGEGTTTQELRARSRAVVLAISPL